MPPESAPRRIYVGILSGNRRLEIVASRGTFMNPSSSNGAILTHSQLFTRRVASHHCHVKSIIQVRILIVLGYLSLYFCCSLGCDQGVGETKLRIDETRRLVKAIQSGGIVGSSRNQQISSIRNYLAAVPSATPTKVVGPKEALLEAGEIILFVSENEDDTGIENAPLIMELLQRNGVGKQSFPILLGYRDSTVVYRELSKEELLKAIARD